VNSESGESSGLVAQFKPEIESASEWIAKDFGLLGGTEIRLVPLGKWALHSPMPALVAEWRNAASGAFMTEFLATPENAGAYLNRVWIQPADNLLFGIKVGNAFVGHLGLANVTGTSAVIDNVMKGDSASPRGLMKDAFRRVLEFSHQSLQIERVELEVLSSNTRAIKLYDEVGFSRDYAHALRREQGAGMVRLIKCESADADSDLTCVGMSISLTS
jgi:RimJ/RimL family protein N-acetyltransferase